MPKAQRRMLLALAVLAVLGTACGPDQLPGFANPPPVDGGTAGSAADDDAG